jgi:HPt (histidine-containing phosphotransfer) domain-containing protein
MEPEFIDFKEGQVFLGTRHLEFLQRFAESIIPEFLQSVYIYEVDHDRNVFKRHVHSFKVQATYIGATSTKILAEKLQILCQNPQISNEKIRESCAGLKKHIANMLPALKSMFIQQLEVNHLSDGEDKKTNSLEDESQIKSKYVIKRLIQPVSKMVIETSQADYKVNEVELFFQANNDNYCVIF